MNLKQYAECKGITLSEAKKLTGLTHWKQIVPESCDEIPEIHEEADISDQIFVEPENEEQELASPFDLDTIALSIKMHGRGSPCWSWRHLL